MSPKRESVNDELFPLRMEVRVSCVPVEGAEPQGIRVRIPEPKKKKKNSNTNKESVSEKDYYRKTSSLDRRDRYSITLSGAEIKRGLCPSSFANVEGDEPLFRRRKHHPMLDRKNRSFLFFVLLKQSF